MDQAIIHNTISSIDEQNCPPIQFEISPEASDVGTLYTLFVFGEFYIPVPIYNSWTWQTADKFESPGVINTNPTWSNAQTGGLTYTQTQDDKIVRLYFNIGSCEYYSNVSGFVLPTGTETALTVTDSSTIDFTTSGFSAHTLTGAVKISATAGNIVAVNPDGIYVPTLGTSITVTDTPTIDLTLTGSDLQANVIISPEAGNTITEYADGLYSSGLSSFSHVYVLGQNSVTVTAVDSVTPKKIPFSYFYGNFYVTAPTLLTGNIAADNFIGATGESYVFEYTISFNQLSSVPRTFKVELYADNNPTRDFLINTTPRTADFYEAISRKGVLSLIPSPGIVYDFRVSLLGGVATDFTIDNFVVVLKPISYAI